jgi:D-xylose transport system ATP-binding protein
LQRLNPNFIDVAAPVSTLSGGQRQAVAIARALQFEARVLIMDEPTAALGPEETAAVGDLIRRLKADGLGIFLVSHDLNDVFELSDRVCVLKGGRLVGTRSTNETGPDEVLAMIVTGKG